MRTNSSDNDRPTLRLVPRPNEAFRASDPQKPPVRRFPPIVQVLNLTVPHIQDRLQDIAMVGFRRGLSSTLICEEIHRYARTLDYLATIGVQEVRTAEMPSFANQVITSTLMLIDLQPLFSFYEDGAEAAD